MLSESNSTEQTVYSGEATLELSADSATRLMRERAAKLAIVKSSGSLETSLLEVITFVVGGERSCLEACYVHEIIPFTAVTPVPGVPDFMIGVINLHGQLVALMDLRSILGLKEREATNGSRVVVIGMEKIEFSVLVDSVESVASLDATTLLEAPEFVSSVGRHYIRGVTRDGMTVLDGLQLINDPRLYVNQNDVQQ